jgi:hypothetical protein
MESHPPSSSAVVLTGLLERCPATSYFEMSLSAFPGIKVDITYSMFALPSFTQKSMAFWAVPAAQ